MAYKEELDREYIRIVEPLESFSRKTNDMMGMLEYVETFGEVMLSFGDRMNALHRKYVTENPEQKEEVEEYITGLKNRLISDYKPK